MKKTLTVAALLLAVGGGTALAAAPAGAAPSRLPGVQLVRVDNHRGQTVLCATTTAGGIDCDWTHPWTRKTVTPTPG